MKVYCINSPSNGYYVDSDGLGDHFTSSVHQAKFYRYLKQDEIDCKLEKFKEELKDYNESQIAMTVIENNIEVFSAEYDLNYLKTKSLRHKKYQDATIISYNLELCNIESKEGKYFKADQYYCKTKFTIQTIDPIIIVKELNDKYWIKSSSESSQGGTQYVDKITFDNDIKIGAIKEF